jgi:hypothetical protein
MNKPADPIEGRPRTPMEKMSGTPPLVPDVTVSPIGRTNRMIEEQWGALRRAR